MYQNDTSLAEKNLREAGVILKAKKYKGWYLASLIAKSVKKGLGTGQNQHTVEVLNNLRTSHGKVSATEASRILEVSTPTVLTYLKAWNRASDDLGIEHSDDLTPGYELDWLTEEWVANHSWEKYYRTVNNTTQSAGNPPSPERQAREFEQAITSNPEFAKQAAESLRKHAPETQQITPEQVREAVRSNPEIEKAAREESFNRLRERAREQAGHEDPTVPNPDDVAPTRNPGKESQDFLNLMAELRKAGRSMRDALYLARQIDEPITNASEITDELRELCDQIEAALLSGGVDRELQALMNGEL